MDRRSNQPISSNLPVRLTHLDDGSDCAGQLQDISESGVSSVFTQPLAPGAIVKLEILGLTLYGHVVYSNPDEDGFRTGIYIEPALLDSTNVIELVKNYLTAAAGRS